MVRFFVLLILFLAVGSVRSDESQELTKVKKQKFLLELLKRLRKIQNHKKSDSPQAISLDQINIRKDQQPTSEPVISQNHQISNELMFKDEKKSNVRSNIIKPTNEQASIGRYWKDPHQRVKPSKIEILHDLLKTLKKIRSHKTVEKTSSTPNSSALQPQSLLQSISEFIASHSQPEEHISSKSDHRSSVMKPIEAFTKVSMTSSENKARYSFALARMSFMEELEKAQGEKLNKLSQLEKEFSSILPKSTIYSNVRVKPTSESSLQDDLKEETGTPLDIIQKPNENSRKVMSEGRSFSDFVANPSKTTHGDKKTFGAPPVINSKSGAEQTFLHRIPTATPWSQVKSHPSIGLSAKSSNGSIKRIDRLQRIFNSLVHKHLTSTNKQKSKSEMLAHLQKLHQKILLRFGGNKTSDPYTVRRLSQASHKNDNIVTAYDQHVSGKDETSQTPQYSSSPMRSAQSKIQENAGLLIPSFSNHKVASAQYSNNNKIDNRIVTEQHQTSSDLRPTSHNNQIEPNAEYQNNESRNKENVHVDSPSDRIREALTKHLIHSDTLPSYSNKNKLSGQVGTPEFITNGNTPQSLYDHKNLTYGKDLNAEEKIKENQGLVSSQKKLPDIPAASYSTQYNLQNQVVTPSVENLHQNSNNDTNGLNNNDRGNYTTDGVKVLPYPSKYEPGNEASRVYSKTDSSSVHGLQNHLNGVYGRKKDQNKANLQSESSSSSVLEMQNKKPNMSNETTFSEPKTDRVLPQNLSLNHKNATSGSKVAVALQKAQGIFLEKVKEILAEHHKSKAVQNNNLGDSNKPKNGKHKSEESVINSSAYVMDESPTTNAAPGKPTYENSGIVPLTPRNPAIPFPNGNTMEPLNVGFNAPRQAPGQSDPGFSSPVQFPGAGSPLTYAEQQEAHEEQLVASQQNRLFQNMQNGASSLNRGNFQYQPSQSFGLNQFIPRRHSPFSNIDFRPPNVDNLDEYRGGMERYQLNQKFGLDHRVDDVGDKPVWRTHSHHYSHYDGDDDTDADDKDADDKDADEDDEDNDDFDDGKKKSLIRKPINRGQKMHPKNNRVKPASTSKMKHLSVSKKNIRKARLTLKSTALIN